MGMLEKYAHLLRHINLHEALVELVVDFYAQTNSPPLQPTVSKLLDWSYVQTTTPDETDTRVHGLGAVRRALTLDRITEIASANSITELYPYRTPVGWSFDDEHVDLQGEAFVAGVPEIIDLYAEDSQNVCIRFSASPFPESVIQLVYVEEGEGGISGSQGNWYRLDGTDMECWFCPALYKYFEKAPDTIYAQVTPTD